MTAPLDTADLAERLDGLRAGVAQVLAARSPGDAVVAEASRAMDRLVRAVMDRAGAPHPGFAVLALGGYGRGELAPHSDVDLLFLVPKRAPKRVIRAVETAVKALWDLGLTIGNATRTEDDCLSRARADMTVRTALLEARRVWGDAVAARRLLARFRREVVAGTTDAFVAAKLAERAARVARFGATRYLVEPNVKEGIGGLRDIQLLGWLAAYGGGTRRAHAMPRRLAAARAFLLAVRCHLHDIAGRAENRLGFDVQPEVARRMGYRDRQSNRAVERFMKRYFLATKEVGDLVRRTIAPLEAEGGAVTALNDPDGAGFVLVGRHLGLAVPDALRVDARAVLRFFHVAWRRRLAIDADALRLAALAGARIDDAVRASPDANRRFLDILTAREGADAVLRAMSETGVLARFVPDFGRVVAQMQYDRYHVYTVDEHSLRALALLGAIERGEHAQDLPLATATFPKIRSRRALYLAVFMHDIAKGRGGDHSVLGAELAEALARRLGLADEEAETAGWLVRHHLLMSRTAFKHDLGDAETIMDFAAAVQSIERLRLLLLLTVADIRATNPELWNGWKGQLLRDLFGRAEEVFSGGHIAEHKRARVEAAIHGLRAALPEWDDAAFAAYEARHFPPYWLSFDPSTHERHARLIAAADGDAGATAIDHRVDTFRDVTEVTIATPDRRGLFSDLAGAIAAAGASIVDARIYTLADGVALDTFWIQDHQRQPFAEERRLARLDAMILGVLDGTVILERELAKRLRPAWSERAGPTVAPRVLVDNDASTKHTVIEVNGRDRPGLLYELTRELTRLNLSIITARITTYVDRAVDVFYVRDRFGLKLTHPDHLRAVRERLLGVLAAPAVAA
ncbi:MAG: [protein-PII] uridylyltransferase [Alphaproteobacteria bacterium]|nr:[protein-PII] uridylyltransferase [Alphaproteobacteria bacterium]